MRTLQPAGLDASRCLAFSYNDTSCMDDGEGEEGAAHETFAMSPRAGSPVKEAKAASAVALARAPAKAALPTPSGSLGASLSAATSHSDEEADGGMEGWSHRRPGGPLEFLSVRGGGHVMGVLRAWGGFSVGGRSYRDTCGPTTGVFPLAPSLPAAAP